MSAKLTAEEARQPTARKGQGLSDIQPYAAQEASRRESSFLGNLAGAQDDYEWLVEHEAWTSLGHESFSDWWASRVVPVMKALSMRPTSDVAVRVIEQVRNEDAALPAAQRRSDRELAELAGQSESAERQRRSRSRQRDMSRYPDLDETPAAGAVPPSTLNDTRQSEPAGLVSTPVGPSSREFADALDRFVPNPDPHAEWRLAFLKRVHAVHAVMRSDPVDVAEKADATCLDELRRCAEAFEDYRIAVNRAVVASTPDNVSPIRRVS